MFRFFQHIRKTLTEQNKVRTYTLYAIGEIFLVVIGILIALQINNWNELNKHKSDIRNHLDTVIENLKDDETQLNFLIDFRTQALVSSNAMLDKYERKEIDDSKEFISAILNVMLEKKFDRHISGFERLEQAELYQSENLLEIRTLIADYSKIIEEITFWETRFNNFTEAMETELFNNGFFYESMYSWRNYFDSVQNNEPLAEYDFQSLMDTYHSAFSLFLRCTFTTQDVINRYNQLKEKGDELKGSIEAYSATS